MAFKKIRHLEPFDGETPLNTGDFLVVSDADGSSTRRATIKEAVAAYNLAVTEELNAQPETITDSSGNEIANPLADIVTQVEVIDTDGDGNPDTETLIDTTPITSENIDKLIKPGGGLEVIEVCKNSDGQIIDCTIDGNPNPEVTIKSKQLSFATSAASKKIIIYLNADEGEEYSGGQSYSIDSSGVLTTKFSRLRDAYAYVRDKVPSKSTTIDIRVETDIDEGILTPADQGAYQSDGTLLIQTRGWNTEDENVSILSTLHLLRKIIAKRESLPNENQAMFWMNSQKDLFQSIHFCVDSSDNAGSHSIFRSDGNADNNLEFYGCKLSFKGQVHALIEANRGGKIAFHSITDDASELDPLDKGFWMPAFEFDFVPDDDLTKSYCSYYFSLDQSASILIIEYGSSNPWGAEPHTSWQGRMHISGADKLRVKHFIYAEASCVFETNVAFTADSISPAIEYDEGQGIIGALGFNTLLFKNNSNIDGTNNSVGFGNSNTDLLFATAISTEGSDYVASFGSDTNFTATNPFVTVQNEFPAKGIVGPVDLSNYFPNHNF